MNAAAGGPALLTAIAGRPVAQVGILVRDLDAALERYAESWDLGPWSCWTMGPEIVAEMGYREGPGPFEMRVALCSSAPQLELVESVRGPNIYEEWLAEHGEGLHHLGFHVESIDSGIAAMAAAGQRPAQWGKGYGADGDGGFAYYDLRPLLGVYLELIEVPAVRRPPERVYPAPSSGASRPI